MFAKANNCQKIFVHWWHRHKNIIFLNITGSFLVIAVQKKNNNC